MRYRVEVSFCLPVGAFDIAPLVFALTGRDVSGNVVFFIDDVSSKEEGEKRARALWGELVKVSPSLLFQRVKSFEIAQEDA